MKNISTGLYSCIPHYPRKGHLCVSWYIGQVISSGGRGGGHLKQQYELMSPFISILGVICITMTQMLT